MGAVALDGGSGGNGYTLDMATLPPTTTLNDTTGTDQVTINAPAGTNVLTLTATQLTGAGETINFNLGATVSSFTVNGGAASFAATMNTIALSPPSPRAPRSAPVALLVPKQWHESTKALKPAEVQTAQARLGLRAEARSRRKNAAYVRQGEWFFIPALGLVVDEKLVLRDEPLTRGNGSKAHWADFCYGTGGETVHVCCHYPNGVTGTQYQKIVAGKPKAKGWGWRTMRRNPGVYVRGRIRHADHKTVVLHGWHRVLMNTQTQAKAMQIGLLW